MKSQRPLALLFTICAFWLTACHQLHAITEIKSDGSGELRTEVGFTAEERQNLEQQSGSGSQDFCSASQFQDASVTEEQRGDETWCITTRKFDNLEELKRLYAEQKGLTVNRLEIENGKFYYDIDIDTAASDSSFANFTAITWTVSLPGTPITHNAMQAEGKTLVWTPTPESGRVNLQAESEVPASGLSLAVLLGALGLFLCAAVVVAGAIAIVVSRRSRQPPAQAGSAPTT